MFIACVARLELYICIKEAKKTHLEGNQRLSLLKSIKGSVKVKLCIILIAMRKTWKIRFGIYFYLNVWIFKGELVPCKNFKYNIINTTFLLISILIINMDNTSYAQYILYVRQSGVNNSFQP